MMTIGSKKNLRIVLLGKILLLCQVFCQTVSQLDHKEGRTVKIYGNATLGYFFINVYVGENKQKESLILDTGSSLTTFPWNGCSDCGQNHYNSLFDYNKSSTFSWLTRTNGIANWEWVGGNTTACNFGVSYVEGSGYWGKFAKDYVIFEDEFEDFDSEKNKTVKEAKYFAAFGCTQKETNMLRDQNADGIFGVGLNSNSNSLPPDLIYTSNQERRIEKDVFSIWFGINGGYFTIGDYNHHTHQNDSYPIQTLSFMSQYQYVIKVHSFDVNDQDIELQSGDINEGQGVFIDSGTTLIHGPPSIIDKIYESISDYWNDDQRPDEKTPRCGGEKEVSHRKGWFAFKNDSHFANVEQWLDSFPHIGINMDNNTRVELHARDYFYIIEEGLWIGLDYLGGRIILGGIFMRNFDILFDRVQKQIRIVRANCDNGNYNYTDHYIKTCEAGKCGTTKRIKKIAEPSFFIKFFIILLAIMLCFWIVYWRLVENRYKDRSIFSIEFRQTDKSFDV